MHSGPSSETGEIARHELGVLSRRHAGTAPRSVWYSRVVTPILLALWLLPLVRTLLFFIDETEGLRSNVAIAKKRVPLYHYYSESKRPKGGCVVKPGFCQHYSGRQLLFLALVLYYLTFTTFLLTIPTK